MALKEYCTKYWLKELQESMDRCNGHHDITEILLTKALNTVQSIWLHRNISAGICVVFVKYVFWLDYVLFNENMSVSAGISLWR